MKKAVSFSINNLPDFKIKMLNWANRFNIFCFLDNHNYQSGQPAFDCLLGVGSIAEISATADSTAFKQLSTFYAEHQGWLFGHFAYDLKNELEQLSSSGVNRVGFDDLSFFVPGTVLEISGDLLNIYSAENASAIYQQIAGFVPNQTDKHVTNKPVAVRQMMSRDSYIAQVKKIQAHILRGDCYEVNYCQEFFIEDHELDPVATYLALAGINPSPFAALYKNNGRYCICASPERYLKIAGDRVISQPVKGTAFRYPGDEAKDEASKFSLQHSEKERSENVMVVDLVRNDLSKVCTEGSVEVTELFGMYSFPQVHQMISTVAGTLQPGLNWIDAVKASFPMGSMTGAPKKKVMELIEQYEPSRRGLYSGAIGYVHPNGNADFNVVIRSILYNQADRYVSFQAGSAITFYSDAEKEYEECILKTAAIRQLLGQQVSS